MRAAIALGAVSGLATALLAVGLVLVYKAGRFVNFAHGQLGVIPAMVLGKAALDWGISWWIAFPLAVALGIGTGALVEVLVVRPLAGRTRVTLLIATIGVSQVLLALTYFEWLGPTRSRLRTEGYPVPFDARIEIDPAFSLLTEHLLVLALVPVITVALAAVLRFTMLGKAIRAAASNPDAAGLAGISVRALSTTTWAVAGGLSAVSAILAAPAQSTFDTQALGPSLLLRALGAAALGGFTSLPAAFAAAVGLGVVEGIALHQSHNAGVAELVVFVAILAALLLRSRTIGRSGRPDGLPIEIPARGVTVPAAVAHRTVVRRAPQFLLGGTLFFAVLAPLVPIWEAEPKQFVLALTLVFALIGVSMVILTGWAGQVSLGQFALVGIGAYTGARLLTSGWSMPAAALGAGAVAAGVAVLVGLPALRLRGLTLAVSTLGLAVVTPAWLLRQEWMGTSGVFTLDPPGMVGLGRLTTQRSVYYAALVTLVLACLAASGLRRSPAGRMLVAVRDNERSVKALGASPTIVKLSAFALSGFLAGIAGVLWAATQRNLAVDQFNAAVSFQLLAMIVIGGMTSIAGAVVGAVLLVGVPALTTDWFRALFEHNLQFQLLLGGTGLVITQMFNPGGIVEASKRSWEHFLAKMADSVKPGTADTADDDEPPLVVEGVRVHFGGVVAVDGASLVVRPGEVVGLIGTNGAGKTTLLDAVSGLVSVDGGSIRVGGVELAQLAPEYRAHFGVARSFQDGSLFPGLTVAETIQLALARTNRTGMVAGTLRAPWVRYADRRMRDRADELIDRLGLRNWADTLTADLSTGTRRICDIAVQMAAEPRLLLLDEPTAGVAQREAEAFGPLLRSVIKELGCAALVIEHDMPLMVGLADRLYCMEAGRMIAEGTPDEVRNDPRVVASYLGTDRVAIERSGAATATAAPRRRRTSTAAPTKAGAR